MHRASPHQMSNVESNHTVVGGMWNCYPVCPVPESAPAYCDVCFTIFMCAVLPLTEPPSGFYPQYNCSICLWGINLYGMKVHLPAFLLTIQTLVWIFNRMRCLPPTTTLNGKGCFVFTVERSTRVLSITNDVSERHLDIPWECIFRNNTTIIVHSTEFHIHQSPTISCYTNHRMSHCITCYTVQNTGFGKQQTEA